MIYRGHVITSFLILLHHPPWQQATQVLTAFMMDEIGIGYRTCHNVLPTQVELFRWKIVSCEVRIGELLMPHMLMHGIVLSIIVGDDDQIGFQPHYPCATIWFHTNHFCQLCHSNNLSILAIISKNLINTQSLFQDDKLEALYMSLTVDTDTKSFYADVLNVMKYCADLQRNRITPVVKDVHA